MTAKRIALVAHDNMKPSLVAWAKTNKDKLSRHQLFGTGTTGALIEESVGSPVSRVESGPLGGDQQLGAMICEGRLDMLIFFWDPLESQPHDPDIKALLRLAVVWDIPVACNTQTANYLISSPLFDRHQPTARPDFSEYRNRLKKG